MPKAEEQLDSGNSVGILVEILSRPMANIGRK
jgi:hypothetical protein